MASNLERVDLAIDANVVILGRCVGAVIQMMNQYIMPKMYGEEDDPATSDGVLIAATELFKKVTDQVKVDNEQIIREYLDEKQKALRLAQEERGVAVEHHITGEAVVPASGPRPG